MPSAGVWRSVLVSLLAMCVVLAGALALLAQERSPRGLIRSLPLPGWLEDLTKSDAVVYQFHATVGTIFATLNVSPDATASEWFKAAWHADSNAHLDAVAQALSSIEQRSSREHLESTLCPYVMEWSEAAASYMRGRQLTALARANLSCGDQASMFGLIPNDAPIDYPSHLPSSGFYHDNFYPTYGVATEPVPTDRWMHNLAHGEIVLLYRCPTGCPEVLEQAQTLYTQLWSGRNSPAGQARLLVLDYESMEFPLAVVAWGQLLPLETFDARKITDFYDEHVDQGIECHNLKCPAGY